MSEIPSSHVVIPIGYFELLMEAYLDQKRGRAAGPAPQDGEPEDGNGRGAEPTDVDVMDLRMVVAPPMFPADEYEERNPFAPRKEKEASTGPASSADQASPPGSA